MRGAIALLGHFEACVNGAFEFGFELRRERCDAVSEVRVSWGDSGRILNMVRERGESRSTLYDTGYG